MKPEGADPSRPADPGRKNRGSSTSPAPGASPHEARLRAERDELRLALEELRSSDRGRAELLGYLAHDMKGPLTAILAEAELLRMAVEEEGEAGGPTLPALDAIATSARILRGMVLDLMDVQASREGRLEPDRVPVDLNELLAQGSAGATSRGASIWIEVSGGPAVEVDPELMRRVIANLVDNCIRYGPEGGAIRLEGDVAEDGAVRIRVRDEGPGVPEALRDAIFEKYTRVERDVGGRRDGSRGLGLRFCRVAVEAHGGSIRVEDNVPVGACFCVELPPG